MALHRDSRECKDACLPVGMACLPVKRGFTLIEVMLVIGLVAVLVGLGYFVNIGFYRTHLLQSERETVVGLLRKARTQSMSNINQAAHGLFVGNTAYTIFQGSSYAARAPQYDEPVAMSPLITAGGLREIIFTQLSGNASASGTITLTNGIATSSVSVNGAGRIQ